MKKLLNVLTKKESYYPPPIWIMRQAGRYLPEYLLIRAKSKNFLDLCYNPKLASEVTIQPIKRFDFDAAIIFSDILVIPDALGIKVNFVKNEGPKLEKISAETELKNLKLNNLTNHLAPVLEAIELTKKMLSKDKSLIGFSGSPWTLACYMIEGGGSKNFELVRRTAISNEKFFNQLIEILSEAIVIYISSQINAGADVIQLFDSWAGILNPYQLQKWVIEPTKKIISKINDLHPKTPLICFPRGIGISYEEFVRNVKPQGIAIDQNVPLQWAKENLQEKFEVVVQGNLDNFLLAFGSKNEIEEEVKKILSTLAINENGSSRPFIFNLGHGILPQTPIENVQFLKNCIESFKK